MRRILRSSALAAAFAVSAVLAGRADGPITETDAELQFQLGTLLSNDLRYYDALDAFQRAAGSPEDALAHRARKSLVRTALVVAEFDIAKREADRLREERPGDVEVLTLHGDALWAAGLFDEADSAYEEALTREPGLSRARFGRARSLATRNQLDLALDEALGALATAPRDGELHFQVGDIYERMRRYDEAANAYTNYINLLPNKDRSERAAWSRSEVTFLRAFEGKAPVAVDGNPDQLHTLPFRLVKDKIIVRARINGSRMRELVLDTGSEETVVSEDTARRLGVRPITYTLSAGVGGVGLRGLQLGRLDSIEIGSLRVENVPVLIKSPGLSVRLPTKEADSFSPLSLGLSMRIDYRKQVLTIGRDLPPEAADFTLPMRIHRLALVRGLLNGERPAYFVVDTGGEVISISTAVASRLETRAPRHIPLKVYGVSGWDEDAFLLPGVDLAFEDLRYTNTPLVVLNLRVPSALLGFQVGGIVGHRFLAPYRVTMDMMRSELRLARY
ncbi:MAG: hypothetical protein FJW23_07855 [Acidimicrobiia bacterium]|nr:hypothetical protein [Acidimicrobiia bacterium]